MRRDAVAHGLMHHARNRDAARLGEAFEARGDVDAVAVDRAVGLLDHVAQVDADAKAHALRLRHGLAGHRERLLDLERGAHGAACRFERGEHRVARHVDDATLVRFDANPEDAARGIEIGQRGVLVLRHEARVARDVRGEDRRQPMSESAIAHDEVRGVFLRAGRSAF